MTDQIPSDKECPICLIDYTDDDSKELQCPGQHKFHTNCINAWLYGRNTCPLCRVTVQEEISSDGFTGPFNLSEQFGHYRNTINQQRSQHSEEQLLANAITVDGTLVVSGNVTVTGAIVVKRQTSNNVYHCVNVNIDGDLVVYGGLYVGGNISARTFTL